MSIHGTTHPNFNISRDIPVPRRGIYDNMRTAVDRIGPSCQC